MATDRQQRLQEVLDRLVKDAALNGALLVSRDGFCMMNRMARLTMPDTFSAMGATLVGAAEAAFGELGEEMPVRVSVETATSRMLIRGVTGELLLVLIGDLDKPTESLNGQTDAAVVELEYILGA